MVSDVLLLQTKSDEVDDTDVSARGAWAENGQTVLFLITHTAFTLLYWIYLLLAAMCETMWTYSLKALSFSSLKDLRWHNFYKSASGLPILLPFLGYVGFGVANIYFFSTAIKRIPTPTAFAVWTALSLILIKLADVIYYKANWSFTEVFFLMLIVVGIIGLKVFETA